MATNPRIDDLRRRLEREPGSRLFAQLAEELRKAGELDDAIRVAREGLERHPAYPSARMTLGRALFDLGDLRAARVELEAVVASAPDNILAVRLLGEALEGLQLHDEAAARYRTVLALAPGDRQAEARLEALALQATDAAEAATPQAEGLSPALAKTLPGVQREELALLADTDAPIPLVALGDEEQEFELEGAGIERRVASAPRPDERAARIEPELQDRFVATDVLVDEASAEAAAGFAAGREEMVFDFEDVSSNVAPTLPFARPEDLVAAERAAAAPPPDDVLRPVAFAGEQDDAERPASASALSSPTLAELYFSQGIPDKAADVYREILEREPWNERARRRLGEIESQLGHASDRALAAVPAGAPPANRREALERAIRRLESLLHAVREGRHAWPASPTH